MHPIERLRYVARASGAAQEILVSESASALGDLGFDPQGLVTSCRRLIAKHPTAGALWWMSARLLTALDPRSEARACVREISGDATSRELAYDLPEEATVLVVGWPDLVSEALARRGDLTVLVVDVHDEGRGLVRRLDRAEVVATVVEPAGLGAAAARADVVVLEADALGPDGFVALSGSRAAAAVAYCAEIPVWVVCGVGRALPDQLWRALGEDLDDDEPWDSPVELVPLGLSTVLCGPFGRIPPEEYASLVSAPMAPELLGRIPN